MTDMISAERDSNGTTTSSMTKKSCNSLHGSKILSLNDAGYSRSAVATDYNRNSDKMDAAEAKESTDVRRNTGTVYEGEKSTECPAACTGIFA